MEQYTYEIINQGTILKTLKRSDGAVIPFDEANADYQAYLSTLPSNSVGIGNASAAPTA